MSKETVNAIQAQIESKVQKELDQLAIIANNQYADGKHVYDYQLVRLSDKEKALEQKQIIEANEMLQKRQNLKQTEEILTIKFENAKKQLDDYKTKFYKNQKNLQQDHDTYVSIRDQERKKLKE
jgi:hypothetical protein